MKTQEIVEYHLYQIGDSKPRIITDSYEEAKSFFEEGWFVTEVHTMKWQPSAFTKTSTTVTTEWRR